MRARICEGEILRCLWHGWEFDLTSGRSIFNPHRMRVRTYEVTIEADEDEAVEAYPVTVEDGVVSCMSERQAGNAMWHAGPHGTSSSSSFGVARILRAASPSHGAISLEADARQLVTVALAILPVLIFFLLAQRSFIAGLTRTGLKG
jgi:hypothetical protein